MNTLTIELDDDDLRAIHEAIALRQRLDYEAFGESLLPDGDGPLQGRVLGEVCRGWVEYMQWLDATKND